MKVFEDLADRSHELRSKVIDRMEAVPMIYLVRSYHHGATLPLGLEAARTCLLEALKGGSDHGVA